MTSTAVFGPMSAIASSGQFYIQPSRNTQALFLCIAEARNYTKADPTTSHRSDAIGQKALSAVVQVRRMCPQYAAHLRQAEAGHRETIYLHSIGTGPSDAQLVCLCHGAL